MTKRFPPSAKITAYGETKSIAEWASEKSWRVQTIIGRLERGWESERAVSEPIPDVAANRGKRFPPELLSADEMKKLLDACGSDLIGSRNRALIALGWRGGLKISEALALRPNDLDREGHIVRVLYGSDHKIRPVGLDLEAWSCLQSWLELRASLPINQASPLFCTREGSELSSRYVRSLMKRLAQLGGVKKRVHFQALRHTMAFELATEHAPTQLIQQQLGHASLESTSAYISQHSPTDTVNWMKSRPWGNQGPPPPNTQTAAEHSSDWLQRLRSEIGDRLTVHDTRTDNGPYQVFLVIAPARPV